VGILIDAGADLQGLRVVKLKKISVQDSTYKIDITAWLEASGAEFFVLVECQHYKSPSKRDVVQILFDKVRAVGGHKGILFSTSRFQSGAVKYSQAHGVALEEIADGRTCYITRGYETETVLPPGVPSYVKWFISLSQDDYVTRRLIIDGNAVDPLFCFSACNTTSRIRRRETWRIVVSVSTLPASDLERSRSIAVSELAPALQTRAGRAAALLKPGSPPGGAPPDACFSNDRVRTARPAVASELAVKHHRPAACGP